MAGEQSRELDERWVLATSSDINNADIYRQTKPTDNLISVDAADGTVIAFLEPELIISKKRLRSN